MAQYSILLDAKFQTKQIQQELDKIKLPTGSFVDLSKSVKQSQEDIEDLALSVDAAGRVFGLAKETITSFIEQVYSLDSALTEFKKVSELSGDSLDDYINKLSEMGRSVARTGSEMTEATTMFRKSGFSDKDAANLAVVAAQFQNIADTTISAEDAASSIVSQIRAFGQDASYATTIIDAYNEVANNFNVGTNDLSNAMEIASSSLATYNNSFEQIIGLVTAGTEIMTGRSSQVARGISTIASRISTSQDTLAEYGIAVEYANGSLKSTYEILTELKPQWDKMTDTQRVALGDTLAGQNQYKVLASIMQNFDHAIAATETALNSQGSALRENSRYMESLEAKTTALKATFEDLANNVIDNELIGALLEAGNGLLSLANTDIGNFVTQVALLSGIGWGATSLLQATNILSVVANQFSAFGTLLSTISTKGGLFNNVISAGSIALGNFSSIALPLIGIISALGIGVYNLYKNYKENNPSLEEATEKLEGFNTQLQSNKNRIDEINSLNWHDLTPELISEREALEQENIELQDQIDKYKKLKQEKAQSILDKASRTETVYVTENIGGEIFSTPQKKVLAEGAELYKQLTEELTYYQEKLLSGQKLSDEEVKDYNRLITEAKQYVNAIDALEDGVDSCTEEQKAMYYVYKDVQLAYRGITQESITYVNRLIEEQKQLGTTTGKLYDLVAAEISVNKTGLDFSQQIAALKTLASEAGFTASAIATVFSMDETSMMNQIRSSATGLMRSGIAKTSEEAMAMAKQNYIQALWDSFSIKDISTKTDTVTSTGTATSTTSTTDAALKVFQSYYKDIQHLREMDEIDEAEYYDSLRTLIDQYITDATANMKKYGLDSKTIQQNMYQYEEEIYNYRQGLIETTKDKLEKEISLLKSELELAEARGDSDETQETIIKKIQNLLHQEADYLRSIKADQEDINSLSKEWWEYQKKITKETNVQKSILEQQLKIVQKTIDAYKEQISDLQSTADAYEKVLSNYVDKELEKLEAEKEAIETEYDTQIDALKTTNEELDKQIEKEKALKDLASAKAKKLLVYKDGQFQYLSDTDAISTAQEAVDEIERERKQETEIKRLEELKQEAVDNIDEQIEAWEKYRDELSDISDTYAKTEEEILLEQQIAINTEGKNWQTRLNALKNFKDQYISYLEAIKKAQEELAEEELKQDQLQGQIDAAERLSEIEEQMAANSKAWHTATEAQRKELEKLNQKLAQEKADLLGTSASFNTTTGTWSFGNTSSGSSTSSSGGSTSSSSSSSSSSSGGYTGNLTSDRDGVSSNKVSSIDAQMAANSAAWHNASESEKKQLEQANRDLAAERDKITGTTSTFDPSTGKWTKYASGTTSAVGGISLVGEQGPELRVLNSGDGIIPSEITRNLWNWGQMNPKSFSSGSNNVFNIDNLTLPNVNDAQSLVAGLKQMAYQRAYKRA